VLKGGLRVYVNQALSPVLVALRSQHALDAVLEAYHNPVAVWWGSPCTFHGYADDRMALRPSAFQAGRISRSP
jgi:hypothetical protein